jgi:hypothetical protein
MKLHPLFLPICILVSACGGIPELPDLKAPEVDAPEAKDGMGFGTPKDQAPGDRADAQMDQISVMNKLKGYKPEDSANLQKVGEALLAATPDMFVHVTEAPNDPNERYDFVPTPADTYEIPEEFPPKTEKKSALSKYGGDLVPVITWNKGDLSFNIHPGYPGPLAVNTTGVVWNVKSSCVLVTLDAGRYHIPCRYLGKGVPHAVDWPAPLRHALLTPDDVKKLAAMKALPESAGAELSAAKDDWEACVKKAGAPAKAEFDALDKKLDEATRRSRGDAIVASYLPKQKAACHGKLDKVSAVLVKLIEARSADRKALYDKVAAKVGAAAKK